MQVINFDLIGINLTHNFTMGLRFAAWNLLLCLLLVCAHRIFAREVTENLSEEVTENLSEEVILTKNVHHAHPSSHMDPITMVFFTLKDLKIGKTMPVYFRKRDPSAYPQALPREEADSIPFSLKQLPYLRELFSFSHDSPQARAMEVTLNHCEVPPIKGENKICATSVESMLDFARGAFGLETEFEVIKTKFLTESTTNFQNYTILQVPKPIFAPKMVACHIMPYPYAIFYCHSQVTENKLFSVSLGGDNGDRVEAVAVCHMDTSHWSRDHASFRVLGIEPGSSHVCHFFQADNIVYVPVPTSNRNVFVM